MKPYTRSPLPSQSPPPLVDLDNARLDEQKQVMQQIIADATCPFCPDHLAKYHKQPILKQGKYWLLTLNQWPYEHTKTHLLAIALQHAEKLQDLPASAGQELWEMFAWAEREYQALGGGFALRFGDTNYSAGTVRHLHAQFFVPDIEAEDFQPVRFKIGKEWEKRR